LNMSSVGSLDDPFRRELAHAARLRESGYDAVATKIVAQFGGWAEQHRAVRRPYHRPVDDAFDSGRANDRHAIHGAQQVLFYAAKIVREQFLAEVLRRFVLRPEAHVSFIGADQQSETFLAEVVFAIPSATEGRRRCMAATRECFSHEVLMLGGIRAISGRHLGHFPGPKPGGIDHPLGPDIAFFRSDDPAPVRLLLCRGDRGEAVDFSTPLTSTAA
jgi:hypothetical protein